MREVLKGDIFWANYNIGNFRGKRIVIAIKKAYNSCVYVVPLSAKKNNYNYKFRIRASIPYANNKVIESIILCDELGKISINDLGEKIGNVDYNTIALINNKILDFFELSSNAKKKETDKQVKIIIHDENVLKQLTQNIDIIKDEIKSSNSASNKWKERVIGFVIGIMGSIVATLIMQ